MASLTEVLGSLGEAAGLKNNFFTRVNRAASPEIDLRMQELEMRRMDRARSLEQEKRALQQQEMQKQMQQQRNQALGNLAPLLSQRFSLPQEQVSELMGLGVKPQEIGALGNLLQAPEREKRRIVEQNGVQYYADTGAPVINNPIAQPKVMPKEAQLFEYEESLRKSNPEAYQRFKQAGSKGNKFKESEVKAASFSNRMIGADEILESVEAIEGFSPIDTVSSLMGNFNSTAKNIASSPELQKYRNASQDWIRAKLRKESGSAISDDEMSTEYQTYFPVYGDSPEVMEQKRELRKRATAGMRAMSQGAYEELFLKGKDNSSDKGVPSKSSKYQSPEDVGVALTQGSIGVDEARKVLQDKFGFDQ